MGLTRWPSTLGATLKSTHLREYEQLLARLKSVRKTAGVTQQQLAKRLRRPQSFVSKYETGERRLDVVEYLQVTHALNADPLAIIEELAQALQLHRAQGSVHKNRPRPRRPRTSR